MFIAFAFPCGTSNSARLAAGSFYPRAVQGVPVSRGPIFDFFAGTEARATFTTYVVVLVIGLGLGFGLPVQPICLTCTNESWNLASAVTGWVYFSAWSVSFCETEAASIFLTCFYCHFRAHLLGVQGRRYS